MGEPKKRVSPKIANQVNRGFERLILLSILGAVRAANAPWESNSIYAGIHVKMPTSYIRLISKLLTFQKRRRGMDVAADILKHQKVF